MAWKGRATPPQKKKKKKNRRTDTHTHTHTHTCTHTHIHTQQFRPLEGSYEANPPFVPIIMDRMCEHILGLLRTSEEKDKALSFAIFLPGWKETAVCILRVCVCVRVCL